MIAQLEGCHRNCDVYEKMAQELRMRALTTDVWTPCFRRAGKFENGVQSAEVESRRHILDGMAR